MDIRREILRNVILCQSLEPLGRRPVGRRLEAGAPLGIKLEHSILAAANSAWCFYDLADRVIQAGRQPECIYDLAYEAQAASVRNRLGGKVNYGRIGLLVPLVAAQTLIHLETGSAALDVGEILERTGDVLHNTSEKDVEYLEKFIRLGYEISARHRERLGKPKPARYLKLKGKYANAWEAHHAHRQIHMVREVAEGYPYCERVYRFLLHNLDEGVLPPSRMVYSLLLPELGRGDVVADILAVGIYLVLTLQPDGVLFL